MAACIKISKLTKCYGRVVALAGLSLEIETGEVFGLLGPNGAGKSTTLYMLTGLGNPTSGKVSVFGKDLRKNWVPIARRMGVLLERPAFFDYLSARRNLLLLAALADYELTIDRALDRVGLLYAADRKVGTFSLGMRQRLGLAQALMTEPELLVLDEPTGGLDAESTVEILRLLRRLADEANVTIIFSSHMLHEVERLCDRVAILNEGRLIACERTETLASYDTKQLEVLVDAPEAAAKRLSEQSWVESIEVQKGRMTVRLNDGTPHQVNAFLVGAGYQVSGLIPRRHDLREYFLRVLNK